MRLRLRRPTHISEAPGQDLKRRMVQRSSRYVGVSWAGGTSSRSSGIGGAASSSSSSRSSSSSSSSSRAGGRWHARITVRGKARHLGYFDDEESAARAYDTVARELGRGLNFPEAVPTAATAEGAICEGAPNNSSSSRKRSVSPMPTQGFVSSGTAASHPLARAEGVAALQEDAPPSLPRRAAKRRDRAAIARAIASATTQGGDAWTATESSPSRRRSSRFVGVQWDRRRLRWQSRIQGRW